MSAVADIIARMQAKLAAADADAPRTCRGRIQIVLADQRWCMDLDRLTMLPIADDDDEAAPADATIQMDNDTFVAIGNKQLGMAEARADGRVRVAGDEALLAAMQARCDAAPGDE